MYSVKGLNVTLSEFNVHWDLAFYEVCTLCDFRVRKQRDSNSEHENNRKIILPYSCPLQFYKNLLPFRSAHIGTTTVPLYKQMYDSCPYPDKEW